MNDLKSVFKKIFLSFAVLNLFSFIAFAQSDFSFDLDALNKDSVFQADLPKLDIIASELDNKDEEVLIKEPLKEWTVMVYMSVKSNLEKSGLIDVNEMESIGSGDKYNVVVELSRMEGFSYADGDWTGARRYYIEKDKNFFKINSPVLMDIPKVNTGDWNHLVDFIKWAKAKYPAKRYMLVLGGHGGGWLKGKPVIADKGISYDDETDNNIDTPQMGKILDEVGKIDVYAFDSCLMQMVEIAYELGSSVDYVVGSEGTSPFSGYSFDGMLNALKLNPDMSSFELSKAVVDSYMPDINFRKTLSVVDAEKLRRLPGLTNDFVRSIMKTDNRKKVIKARKRTRKYAYADNKDFYDFIEKAVKRVPDENVKAKGKTLMSFLKNDIIAHKGESSVSFKKGNGIAIYLPSDKYDDDYNELKWARDSIWDDFIEWQLN